MPKVTPPKYPKELTISGWNKTKGLIARVKKIKTGVSEELTDAKAAFDKIKWDDLQIGKMIPEGERLTAAAGEKYLRAYLEKYQPVFKALELKFYELSQFLKKKSGEFAKDKDTKSFAKGVMEMSEAANKFTYAVAWGTVSSENQLWMTERIKQAKVAEKQAAEAGTRLSQMIDDAIKATKEAQSGKLDSNSYERPFWSQHLRGIGAQIKLAAPHLNPEVAKKLLVVNKKVATLWNDKSLPTTEEIPNRLKKDLEMLNEFKSAMS